MPEDAILDEVRKHKGFTKSELTRVIDKAIMLSLPPFDEVQKASGMKPEMYTMLSLPYVQILADSNKTKDDSFPMLYNATLEVLSKNPFDGKEIP